VICHTTKDQTGNMYGTRMHDKQDNNNIQGTSFSLTTRYLGTSK
jgi:hypothetical protein